MAIGGLLDVIKSSKWYVAIYSNPQRLRLIFICVYSLCSVWQVFLILKNMKNIRDIEVVPPPEYEIPPNSPELVEWKLECHEAKKKSVYHLCLTVYLFLENSCKLFTSYHLILWLFTHELTGIQPFRALSFVFLDCFLTQGVRSLASIVFMVMENGWDLDVVQEFVYVSQSPTQSPTGSYSVETSLNKLGAIWVYEIFDETGIDYIVAVHEWLNILYYKKIQCVPELHCTPIVYSANIYIAGHEDMIDLASEMGFNPQNLMLDWRDTPPSAIHYSFFFEDVIVITMKLLKDYPPKEAKSLIEHELIHWKCGFAFLGHCGSLFYLFVKLVMCNVVLSHDMSSFFKLDHQKVHPLVTLTLVYSHVLPLVNDIMSGFGGWIRSSQVLICDRYMHNSKSPLSSSSVHLKQALVRQAFSRGTWQKFDNSYSTWFFGQPSLVNRINCLRQRN